MKRRRSCRRYFDRFLHPTSNFTYKLPAPSNSDKFSLHLDKMVKIVLDIPPTLKVNPKFGEADSTFKLVDSPAISQLGENEVLLKLLYLSNDPTQRGWMAAGQDASRAYQPPILKGESIRSLGLAEVLESKSEKYKAGDIVNGLLAWQDKIVVHESRIFNVVPTSSGLPLPIFLSSLGMTGLTAYFGLKEVGLFKEGQSVLISAAAGATGSMAVQIAKHLFKASKVIGIAGSDDKCKWVESLGADYCVNYKSETWKDDLSKYIGTDFVDVYYDNIGGDMLSYALGKIKRGGRVVACGALSGYEDKSKYAVTTWFEIIINRLTVQGFIVGDFAAQFPQAVGEIAGAIKEGKIRVTDAASVIDISGEENPWEKVPSTWYKLFTEEKPNGKLVTKVA